MFSSVEITIQPVEIGLELELDGVVVAEGRGTGLGGEPKPRHPRFHIRGENRFEDALATHAPSSRPR